MEDYRALLAEECDRYGLPHDLATLLRHLRGNHEAALGAERLSVEILEAKLAGAVDENRILRERIEHAMAAIGEHHYGEAWLALSDGLKATAGGR